MGENKLYEASVTVLAFVDVATGDLIEDKCYLKWQLTEKECNTSEKYSICKKKLFIV